VVWIALAVAAAAALVALFALDADRSGGGADGAGDEGPRLVGTESLRILAPGKTFGDGVVFEWQGTLAAGETFRVRAFDAADPLAFAPVLESPTTTETRWKPSEAQARSLPDELRWTVERVGPDGAVRASVEAFSRRSPP
jgi:hypothetical protein